MSKPKNKKTDKKDPSILPEEIKQKVSKKSFSLLDRINEREKFKVIKK